MGMKVLIIIVSIVAFGGTAFGIWVDRGSSGRKQQSEEEVLSQKEK